MARILSISQQTGHVEQCAQNCQATLMLACGGSLCTVRRIGRRGCIWDAWFFSSHLVILLAVGELRGPEPRGRLLSCFPCLSLYWDFRYNVIWYIAHFSVSRYRRWRYIAYSCQEVPTCIWVHIVDFNNILHCINQPCGCPNKSIDARPMTRRQPCHIPKSVWIEPSKQALALSTDNPLHFQIL